MTWLVIVDHLAKETVLDIVLAPDMLEMVAEHLHEVVQVLIMV
jgi:hypothetical protein